MEKTISSAILTKGISKEGFTNLLNDIEYAVIDEGIDIITEESDKIINIVREKKPGEETEEWIKKFQEQIAVLDKVIEENIDKIEMLFERIFKDWEEYEKTNINVIDLENTEEVGDVSNIDNELTDKELQEEVKAEEIEPAIDEEDNSTKEVEEVSQKEEKSEEEEKSEDVELDTDDNNNSSEEVNDNPDVEDNDEVKTEGEKDE